MKYSPMPLLILAVVLVAFVLVVRASSRAQIDKAATAKCVSSKVRDDCLNCCGRQETTPSFSTLDNECTCVTR